MRTTFLVLAALFFVTEVALAPARSFEVDRQQEPTRPKQVLLIRHAEKTNDEDIHLSPKGKKRAEAMPKLFRKSDDRPDPFPRPDFIFPAKQSTQSNRSVETVTPLAKELNLYLNAEYEDDAFAELAAELLSNPRYAGRTVLVCWHHGNLPKLAGKLKAADVPDEWKDHVFDRVWVVAYTEQGKGKPLIKRHQELLPGDSKEDEPSHGRNSSPVRLSSLRPEIS